MPSAEVTAITKGPKHHFFGYYNKSPWNSTMTHLLVLQTDFMDRPPTGNEEMLIGLTPVDKPGTFEKIASTKTWNWQQSSMVQWIDDDNILFNSRLDDRFVSNIVNIHSGKTKVLPHPVYHLSPDKRLALLPNFSRLHDLRPGYGYPGLEDPNKDNYAPDDDGVFIMDMATGQRRLMVSLAQLADEKEKPSLHHWVNHLEFNRDGSRFVFLHRWKMPNRQGWQTRMLTMSSDGGDRYVLRDDGMTSHFDWRDADHMLAFARVKGVGDRYFLFTDRSQDYQIIADGVLMEDGHCSYSPRNKDWFLTDTYPDANGNRALILYNLPRKQPVTIGKFYGAFTSAIECRCDFHPRWSPDGRQICFDSFHEGTRQMYVMNIESIVG
ncbi:MAG: hypothetical protein GXY38_07355 [Planctomycetes bacterium]|jgi:hypothetical protein|nr:hypothetical protein [Planctomycetota bacterium]